MPQENTSTPQVYPYVGFHFKVAFSELDKSGNDITMSFQSVEGLKITVSPTTWKEGGENRFEHSLMERPKYSPLVLKRGLITDTRLYDWCFDAFYNMKVRPINLNISLLDEKHETVLNWNVVHAIPTSWEVSSFDAAKSEIVLESLQLTYNYFVIGKQTVKNENV